MIDKVVGLDGKPLDNVVALDVVTLNDLKADDVLEAAKKENLRHVIVIGIREDDTTYYASSTSDIAEMNLQVDIFKRQIIKAAILGE